MPAKKRSSSARSTWSSGRAPAWVRERGSATKKTSAASKGAKKSPSRSTAAKSTARKSTARKAATKRTASVAKRAGSTTKRPAAKTTRSSGRRSYTPPPGRARGVERTEEAIGRELLDFPTQIDESQHEPMIAEGLAASGGIAIAGVTPSTLEASDDVPVVSEAPAPELERRSEDLPMGLVAAVLAFAAFLPWYKAGQGADAALTGWETGTWGPLIAFLGTGAVLLIGLRRLGVRVSLPYPESIVLEAIGWVATLTAILKARFRPDYLTGLKAGLDNRIWIAVGAGLALALLAGRASGKTPFVAVPGWFKGKAGKLGVALLIVMVAGGAAFGMMNRHDVRTAGVDGGVRPGPQASANTVKGRLPDCAKGFPLPANVKPYSGQSTPQTSTCVALLTSTAKAPDVAAAFKAALTKAGYKFTVKAGVNDATVITLTSPKCGTLQIVAIAQTPSTKAIGNSFTSLILTPCASPSPR